MHKFKRDIKTVESHTINTIIEKLLLYLLDISYSIHQFRYRRTISCQQIPRNDRRINDDKYILEHQEIVTKSQLEKHLKKNKSTYRWYVVREKPRDWWIFDSLNNKWQKLDTDDVLQTFLNLSYVLKDSTHSICYPVMSFLHAYTVGNSKQTFRIIKLRSPTSHK